MLFMNGLNDFFLTGQMVKIETISHIIFTHVVGGAFFFIYVLHLNHLFPNAKYYLRKNLKNSIVKFHGKSDIFLFLTFATAKTNMSPSTLKCSPLRPIVCQCIQHLPALSFLVFKEFPFFE